MIAFPLHRVRRRASSAIFSAIHELAEHEAHFRLQAAWAFALWAAVVLSALVAQQL